MKKKHYKRVLYIFISLFLICFLGIGVFYFITTTQKDISMQNEQYLSEISCQNAVAIEKVVNLNFEKLSAIAAIINREDDLSTDNILKILSIEAERASYKRMGFATSDGIAVTTDHQTFDVLDRDFFYNALNGENTISDRLIDKVDGQFINVYAVPLYENSKICGVIFATCTTEFLADILETPLFGSDGYVYIVTKNGDPVVYMANSADFSNFSNLFDVITGGQIKGMQENMQAGKNSIAQYGTNGEEKIAAYQKININDWYLVSVVPKKVISQSANQIVVRNTVVSAIIIVVVLLFVLAFALQRKKTTIHLNQLAYFDPLIEFPNYNAFLEKALMVLKSNPDKQFAFIMLDVDNFKLINECLGFEIGNRVLINMALAISQTFTEPHETFARIYIDEYIIMLDYKGMEYIKNVRKNFEKRFFELMGKEFNYYIKFPTGRYITDKGETSIKEICEKVNYAHRKAKQLNEQSGICEFFYDFAEKQKALRRMEIENRMNDGIANKEFKVYLQPKYLLKDESIVGAEALVRWQAEDGTIAFPGEFIPLFEQNGFVVKLDLYMLEETCAIMKNWRDGGMPLMPVSINFSRLHLLESDFISKLVEITEKYDIPRKYIEIELTESVMFEHENLIADILQQAHVAGFLLSMDDFGSGYSSLGLLKNIPVDIIKLDRSFFINNNNQERAKKVIEVAISLARKLKIHTVAEGVEDAELIPFLREVGCDIVQGYYYAKPMEVKKFNELIQSHVSVYQFTD